MAFQDKSLKYNNSDLDFDSPLNVPGKVVYTTTFTADNGISSDQKLELDIPPELFNPNINVNVDIDPIPSSIPINSNLIVNFNYRGSQPATMFEVGILNKGKTQRSPLLFISQRANPSNNYNVTLKIPNNPNITSTDCFVFVTAIVGRTRTIFYSNQFELVDVSALPILTIDPIPTSNPVNQPINVTFTYSDPNVDFVVIYVDVNNNQRKIIQPSLKGVRQFSFIPNQVSKIGFIKMFARKNSKFVATAQSNSFEITPPRSSQPPNVSLSIDPVSDFSVSESRKVKFSYTGPQIDHFDLEFFDSENNLKYSGKLKASAREFEYTANKTPSNNCMFTIFAIAPDGTKIADAHSNSFKITPPRPSQPPNVSLSIEPINDFTVEEKRKVKFNYTGPQIDHFDLEFFDSENNLKYSGKLKASAREFEYTANKTPSNNCMFTIFAIAPDGTKIADAHSNSFKILSNSNSGILTISQINDCEVNKKNPISFTFDSNAHHFKTFFVSESDPRNPKFYKVILGNLRTFNFSSNIPDNYIIAMVAFDRSNNVIGQGSSNKFKVLGVVNNNNPALSLKPTPVDVKEFPDIDPEALKSFTNEASRLGFSTEQIRDIINRFKKGTPKERETLTKLLIDRRINQKLITALNPKQITAKDYETSVAQISINNQVIPIGSRDSEIPIYKNQELNITINNLGKQGYIYYTIVSSHDLNIISHRFFRRSYQNLSNSISSGKKANVTIALSPNSNVNLIKNNPPSLDILLIYSLTKIYLKNEKQRLNPNISTKITFIPQ